MSNPTAHPEAQEPWVIWDQTIGKWWAPEPGKYTADIERAVRYERREAEGFAVRGGSTIRAVSLSDALQYGMPGTPEREAAIERHEARQLANIRAMPEEPEAQEPKPGEVWRWLGYGGGDVRVVRVDGSRVIYERDGWDELFSAPLASWHIEFSRVEAKPTTPPDYQADVRAFHEALVPDQVADRPTMPPEHVRDLRLELIEEEFGELWAALHRGDLVAVADALADLLYVTYGTAVACGIDIAPVWREVHRSNMAKDGGPTRADGKLLKPEGWTPPDVRGELERQGWSDDGRGGEPPNGGGDDE